MRRLALFLALLAGATALLLHLAGGIEGPVADRDRPAIPDARMAESEGSVDLTSVVPGTHVQATGAFDIPWVREPFDWTDPETGAVIRIPSLISRKFQAAEFAPISNESDPGGRVRQVQVRFYRLPRTAREARIAQAGGPEVLETLLDLVVEADEARADGLQRWIQSMAGGSKADVGPIRLAGRVHIEDADGGLVIDGSDLVVHPDRDEVRGDGRFRALAPAYEIEGTGLVLERSTGKDRVRILRDVSVAFVADPQRRASAGSSEAGSFRPTTITSLGEAVLLREEGGGRQRLTLDMKDRVHAEQVGGRTLDADEIQAVATCPCPESTGRAVPTARWRFERVQASGAVRLSSLAEGDERDPFVASAEADRLDVELREGEPSTTVLWGHARVHLQGAFPLDGTSGGEDGQFLAEAEEEVRIGPAAAADVPAGRDAKDARRIVLRKGARLVRSTSPLARDGETRDELRGDTISVLALAGASGGRPLVASFAADGDVHLGGTRLLGTTPHVVAEALDTESPRIALGGPGTRIEFVGFQRGQRLLRNPEAEERANGADGSPTAAEPQWALERLEATGGVRAQSQYGGPAVGVPVRLEGATLAFDRTSDQARLLGGSGASAIAASGEPGSESLVSAPAITLEVSGGVFRATGGTKARVFTAADAGLGPDVRLPASRRGTSAVLSLETDHPIEILLRRRGTRFEPLVDAEQVVRVEGPFTAEMRSDDGVADRLRADRLDLAMALRAPEPSRPAPTSPLARAGSRERAPSPSSGRGRAEALEAWDLVAREMTARLAGGRLASFEASGDVALDGPQGEVRGERLHVDAQARRIAVDARPSGRAEAAFGRPGERSRVAATRIESRWDDRGASEVVARAPASALLVRPDPSRPGRLERYAVASRGDLVVDRRRLSTSGWVEVRREVRESASAAWGDPWTLWTERLSGEGKDLLAREGSTFERLVAEGPRTTFTAGTTKDPLTVWGDRFEADLLEDELTVTGTTERPVVLRRGPADAPRRQSEFRQVVLDLESKSFNVLHEPMMVLPRNER